MVGVPEDTIVTAYQSTIQMNSGLSEEILTFIVQSQYDFYVKSISLCNFPQNTTAARVIRPLQGNGENRNKVT